MSLVPEAFKRSMPAVKRKKKKTKKKKKGYSKAK